MDSNPATHFLTSVVLWNHGGRIHDPFILASSMSPKLLSPGWYSLAANLRWAITLFHMLKQLVSRRKQLFWISPFTSWKISWVESYPEGTLPIVPRKNYWFPLNGANPLNPTPCFLTCLGYNKLLSALFLSKLCVCYFLYFFPSYLLSFIVYLHELSVITTSQTQCCAILKFPQPKKHIYYFKI